MIYHWHHIIPRHAGGTNDPSNLVRLTVAEHAEAHRLLFEQYGTWQDRVAWLSLSGQINCAEAILIAATETNRGKPKSPEHRAKLSVAKRGVKMSMEACLKMSASRTGLSLPPEVRKKIGDSQRGKIIDPESVRKANKTRQALDGTAVIIEGRTFGSFSEAARAMAPIWGITHDQARGLIRRLAGYKRPIEIAKRKSTRSCGFRKHKRFEHLRGKIVIPKA